MHSWRKNVSGLLMAVLAVVILFLVWTNTNYNAEAKRRLRMVDEQALSLWMESAEMRLDAVHTHFYDLMLTVYNAAPVHPGAAAMDFAAQREVQAAVDEKLLVSTDADCFFLTDTETGWFLFRANPRTGYEETLLMKAVLQEHLADFAGSLPDTTWGLAPAGEGIYLVQAMTLGRYMAGVLCNTLNFDINKTMALMGDETVCLLLSEGEVYYEAGERSLAEKLHFGKDGTLTLGHGKTVISREFPTANCTVVLAAKDPSLFRGSGWVGALSLAAASLLCLLLILALIRLLLTKVVTPTRELLTAQQEIGSGNLQYRITGNAGSTEFDTLYKSFNNMAEQIRSLRIEAYDRLIRERESQLQMVRAQIRPHFYLNAITTISNMTYQNRSEDIRAFLQALSKYMRYMLNIKSRRITVGEELNHIRSYLKMQELRFPGSVHAEILCPEELEQAELPFLTLFTLVENTFKHALDLYSTLELRILCEPIEEEGFRGCRLTVEDNGPGFPPEILKEYNSGLSMEELPQKEHLGLSNIRYTLQMTYYRNDLLRLSNLKQGARAELWIPMEEEKQDETVSG